MAATGSHGSNQRKNAGFERSLRIISYSYWTECINIRTKNVGMQQKNDSTYIYIYVYILLQKSCIWLNKVGCRINDHEIFTHLSLSSVFSQTIKTICYFSSLSRNLWNHTPKASCQLSKNSDTSCSSNWICLPCFISFSSTRNKPKGHSKANKKPTSAYFEWICFNKTNENKLKTAKLAPSSQLSRKGKANSHLNQKNAPVNHPTQSHLIRPFISNLIKAWHCQWNTSDVFIFFFGVSLLNKIQHTHAQSNLSFFLCVFPDGIFCQKITKRGDTNWQKFHNFEAVRPHKPKNSNGWAAFRFAR